MTGAIDAALAGHFGRDALHDLARGAVVDQDVELGLAEQVDEARRDDEVRRVDRRRRRRARQVPDRRDPVADDADVTAEPRAAGAVHDPAVPDDHVVAGGGGLSRDADGRHGAQNEHRGRQRAEPFVQHARMLTLSVRNNGIVPLSDTGNW